MKKCVGVILVIVILLSISTWCEKVPYEDFKTTEKISETIIVVPTSYLLNEVSTDDYIKNDKIEQDIKNTNDDFVLLKKNNKTTHSKFVVTSVDNEENKPTKKPQVVKTVKKSNSNNYSDDDFYVLSHAIYGESSGQSWDFQVAVGSVILNRVKSNKYPNTIRKVVFQKGQYACTWDGNFEKEPDARAWRNASIVLVNGSLLPDNLVYQADFKQGSGVHCQISDMYFCYL